MNSKKLLKILLPCVGLGFAVSASAQSVSDIVSYTFKTNPDLLIETNTRKATDQELRQSLGGYLPTVDITAGYGKEYSNNATTRALPTNTHTSLTRREAGIAVSQLLFDGFGTYYEVARNRDRVNGAAYRVFGTAEEVALNTVVAYIEVMRRMELVDIAEKNLAAHQEYYSKIKKRSDQGVGRKADLDQAQARLSLARTNLLAEQANLRDARTNYMRVVGMPPENLEPVSDPMSAIPASIEEALQVAAANHPLLRAANYDLDSAKHQYKSFQSTYYPRFDVELGLTRNRDIDGQFGKNNDTTAMVRMRYNVFRGGSDVARVRQTGWEIQQAAETRNRTRRQVEESLRLDWSLFQTAMDQLPHFKRNVDATRNTRDAYTKQFDIGQRTLLDVLDSENELFGTRTAYTSAKYDAMLGKYRVLNSMGALVSYLGVALPEEAAMKTKYVFSSVDELPPSPGHVE